MHLKSLSVCLSICHQSNIPYELRGMCLVLIIKHMGSHEEIIEEEEMVTVEQCGQVER